jgi:hypothetical protein
MSREDRSMARQSRSGSRSSRLERRAIAVVSRGLSAGVGGVLATSSFIGPHAIGGRVPLSLAVGLAASTVAASKEGKGGAYAFIGGVGDGMIAVAASKMFAK